MTNPKLSLDDIELTLYSTSSNIPPTKMKLGYFPKATAQIADLILKAVSEKKRIDWCPSENCHYNQAINDTIKALTNLLGRNKV